MNEQDGPGRRCSCELPLANSPITKGDWVVVRSLGLDGDVWKLRRADSGVEPGHKFAVVFVVRPTRWEVDPDHPWYSSAWPADDVHRVQFMPDPPHGWGFKVASLDIVGGAATREEAERQVIGAADFAWKHRTVD